MQLGNTGIRICTTNMTEIAAVLQAMQLRAADFGISEHLETVQDARGIAFRLSAAWQEHWMPGYDTLQLCTKLHLDSGHDGNDLEQEILLTMLAAPVLFEFPSDAELGACMRMRRNIVQAARRTALAFDTHKIERPTDCWTYSETTGFTVLPGKSLIEALRKATQPTVSGDRYAFSCYRATEYVILLGIAEELAECNPALLAQLQQQWERRAIMSRQFHDVFTREFGSMSDPLPAKYYVPGDRLWFRNPDQRSADIMGYEGSWVMYLGDGLYTNFWTRDQPYTLAAKCIEIYHWRNGVYEDADGQLQMDEDRVAQHVSATLRDPAQVERILAVMMRMRDPQEVFADGGCIDASRECPRWVCPGSADLVLPAV